MIQSLMLLCHLLRKQKFIVFNFYSFPFNKIIKLIECMYVCVCVSRSYKAMSFSFYSVDFLFLLLPWTIVVLSRVESVNTQWNWSKMNERSICWMSDVKHNGSSYVHDDNIFLSHKCGSREWASDDKITFIFSLDSHLLYSIICHLIELKSKQGALGMLREGYDGDFVWMRCLS